MQTSKEASTQILHAMVIHEALHNKRQAPSDPRTEYAKHDKLQRMIYVLDMSRRVLSTAAVFKLQEQ